MGLEEDARRIANEHASAEQKASQVRRAAAQNLASMHPWNINVDNGAQALLSEFVRSATRKVRPLPFMVFRGVPRPGGRGYSKGDRTGLEGWCLFATRMSEGAQAVSDLSPRIHLLGVTSEARLVCVTGLAERETYTNTGFMGPKVVICLPPRPPNPYHGRVLDAGTPIDSAHVLFRATRGSGPAAYDPGPDYSERPLRGVLAYNLAGMMHHVHPQQTGGWKF
jgi:hypothetical protein